MGWGPSEIVLPDLGIFNAVLPNLPRRTGPTLINSLAVLDYRTGRLPPYWSYQGYEQFSVEYTLEVS